MYRGPDIVEMLDVVEKCRHHSSNDLEGSLSSQMIESSVSARLEPDQSSDDSDCCIIDSKEFQSTLVSLHQDSGYSVANYTASTVSKKRKAELASIPSSKRIKHDILADSRECSEGIFDLPSRSAEEVRPLNELVRDVESRFLAERRTPTPDISPSLRFTPLNLDSQRFPVRFNNFRTALNNANGLSDSNNNIINSLRCDNLVKTPRNKTGFFNYSVACRSPSQSRENCETICKSSNVDSPFMPKSILRLPVTISKDMLRELALEKSPRENISGKRRQSKLPDTPATSKPIHRTRFSERFSRNE